MASTVQRLDKRGLIKPSSWLPANVCFETMMGSIAYGCNTDESDIDVYGFCLPPKEIIFPHLAGEIEGFGRQKQRFEQWQEHHIADVDKKIEYDFSIYSIVKYVSLCMENNPNIIDSLFTPDFCVLHITEVGCMIRRARNAFLHKGAWHKFKGYAYSQLHKMDTKEPIGGRVAIREKYGYDVKFAYHVVRLLDEVEQIMEGYTLDLQRSREHLKAIRRGDVSLEDIKKWFSEKEIGLEKLYHESKLPHSPDEPRIKQLLLDCLEHHYGDLSMAVVIEGKAERILAQIKELVNGY